MLVAGLDWIRAVGPGAPRGMASHSSRARGMVLRCWIATSSLLSRGALGYPLHVV